MVTNVNIISNLLEQLLDWTIHNNNNTLYHFVVIFSRALLNHTLIANYLSHSGAWSNQEWKGSELDAILAHDNNVPQYWPPDVQKKKLDKEKFFLDLESHAKFLQ